jgi:ParB-like chromosome segregation protein Spo0J
MTLKEKDDKKLYWKTEKRKVKDLKLFEGNPRKMTEAEAEQLLKSLEKFNLVEIPAIDQNNRVIAGNMRITALKKLGKDNDIIDVRVPSRPLTEKEAKEYLLRSNKNTGEWDWELLTNFEEELLKNVGFDSQELDKIFILGDDKNDDEVPPIKKKRI